MANPCTRPVVLRSTGHRAEQHGSAYASAGDIRLQDEGLPKGRGVSPLCYRLTCPIYADDGPGTATESTKPRARHLHCRIGHARTRPKARRTPSHPSTTLCSLCTSVPRLLTGRISARRSISCRNTDLASPPPLHFLSSQIPCRFPSWSRISAAACAVPTAPSTRLA